MENSSLNGFKSAACMCIIDKYFYDFKFLCFIVNVIITSVINFVCSYFIVCNCVNGMGVHGGFLALIPNHNHNHNHI